MPGRRETHNMIPTHVLWDLPLAQEALAEGEFNGRAAVLEALLDSRFGADYNKIGIAKHLALLEPDHAIRRVFAATDTSELPGDHYPDSERLRRWGKL
jgi:hypothetical protein